MLILSTLAFMLTAVSDTFFFYFSSFKGVAKRRNVTFQRSCQKLHFHMNAFKVQTEEFVLFKKTHLDNTSCCVQGLLIEPLLKQPPFYLPPLPPLLLLLSSRLFKNKLYTLLSSSFFIAVWYHNVPMPWNTPRLLRSAGIHQKKKKITMPTESVEILIK